MAYPDFPGHAVGGRLKGLVKWGEFNWSNIGGNQDFMKKKEKKGGGWFLMPSSDLIQSPNENKFKTTSFVWVHEVCLFLACQEEGVKWSCFPFVRPVTGQNQLRTGTNYTDAVESLLCFVIFFFHVRFNLVNLNLRFFNIYRW